MKVHIGRPSTLEVCQVKVLVTTCSKWAKKVVASLTGLGTAAELLLISNRVLGAPLAGAGLERKFKAQYKPLAWK